VRSINNTCLNCPEGWDDRAATAREEAGNNLKEINRRSAVWRTLKDPLAALSHDKCWYCEMKQERSDNAVDHFRPKSLYPCLAFEKTNFRYSCTYCNSQRRNPETGETEGKGDVFPLLDERKRSKTAKDIYKENPLLLDPCKTQDPGFLDFYQDGTPCAKYPKHKVRQKRVITSIKAYHLDHPDLVEKRRVLAANIQAIVKEADALFEQCDAGNPAVDHAFSGLIRALSMAISETAELSVFARIIISGDRNKEWVEALLNTA
jgi:uncharacterized protein (TIGR02646 family)